MRTRRTNAALGRRLIWTVTFAAILALADSGANAQCFRA